MFNKSQTLLQLFLAVVFLMASLSAYAQTHTMVVARTVNVLDGQPAQEKVYLHLDKPNYGFGDTIWYKAYTVVGQHHQLSALSGVLYVELISQKDSLVTRQTVRLTSGIGWSDIPLSVTLKPGNYRLRAYSRWMQNFGPDAFDEQRVIIGGIMPMAVKTAEKYDVQFFPEGGDLVDGVRSRVAVKVVGVNGLGKDITGTIENNSGNVVADFSTQHLGMGVFALVPEAGKSYKAKINVPGEASFTVDLPKSKPTGYTLSINNSRTDSIYIKIATNDKTLATDKDKNFYIIAQSNGKVYYTTQGKLEGTIYMAALTKSRFPEGIAQFTLFSQSDEPLAERIAFIENKADELYLSINTNSQTYNTRDKVSLNLIAKNSANKPVTGSFSVSVINESKASPDENNESTILNNLLLTSDLKGYIEQPNYYFTDVNEQKLADLDLVMLTQGYRRFEWKQVLNSPVQSTSYQPEKTLDLSGTIRSNSSKPIPRGSLTLVAAKQNLLLDTTADESGRFIFKDLALNDTTGLVLKARKVNGGDNIKITIDTARYPVIMPTTDGLQTQPKNTEILKQQYADYQASADKMFLKNGKTLKQVNIKGYKRAETPKIVNSANLNGPGNADQIIMDDKIQGGITLSDCLQGKAFGVTFTGGAPHNLRKLPPPKMAVIIDGNILDGSHLDDISASDVYSIEVLRTGSAKSIYGSSIHGDGALVITTKRGNNGTKIYNIQPDGLITLQYVGYYKSRTFYTSRYSSPKRDTEIKDIRSTIYWNPNIITDKDGKASLEFYNNDTNGTYRIVIEGIDDEGNLGRQVYKYEVK